jgi:hypothetical protein
MPNDQISPLWNMATARRQPYSKVAGKGEGRLGSVPRAALDTYFLVYLLNYLLTSVDRVVS